MSVVTLAPPENPQKHKVRTYEAKHLNIKMAWRPNIPKIAIS